MAEQRNGGLHPHEGLAVEGEDGEEEDRVGLKVEGMNHVMREHGVEKLKEGRDEPRKDVVEEEGEDRTRQGSLLGGANPKLGLSSLVVIARCQREHGGEMPDFSDGGQAEGRRDRRSGVRGRASELLFLGRHW